MIKFREGNTRLVLILFNFLVLKFPNPRFDSYRNSFKNSKNFLSFLKKIPTQFYTALLYGVVANISEALVCVRIRNESKAPHLVGVFTLGICNFQLYQGEEIPTPLEMETAYKNLSASAREWLQKCNCHERSRYNWRKTPQGLRLIDYAIDPFLTAWGVFLCISARELPLKKATVKT